MFTYKTKSWLEVETFYQTLVETHKWSLQPMLELVRFIARSPYADGLFPITSHATLHIGRYNDFLPDDNELTTTFDTIQQHFVFTHQTEPHARAQWTQSCSSTDGRAALEHFLHSHARWFSYT